MIILAKTSQLFSSDSLVGKSSYGSIALPPDEGLEGRPSGTGKVQTVSDRQGSLQLYIGLRANPGLISLKRRAVRVRLHLPEQFNGSFKELICQLIQGVKLFL